jgi:hypothetical protein
MSKPKQTKIEFFIYRSFNAIIEKNRKVIFNYKQFELGMNEVRKENSEYYQMEFEKWKSKQ